MRPPPQLLVAVVGVALLAGCGTSPAEARRAQVAALTEAANVRDADEVRKLADALRATVTAQAGRDELTEDEAGRLTALVRAVHAGADQIDADLLERRRLEAEAEQARRELEQERRKAEQAAREDDRDNKDKDDDEDDDEDKGGKGKGGKD
ncbi:MAG: hypothetical protein WD794_13925 [Mycobacteriales bacterium]